MVSCGGAAAAATAGAATGFLAAVTAAEAVRWWCYNCDAESAKMSSKVRLIIIAILSLVVTAQHYEVHSITALL